MLRSQLFRQASCYRQSTPASWPLDCTICRRMFDEKHIERRLKEKLMNVQRKIFASIGIALLCAAASFAQQVKTDYDRSADFSQYKTYSWEKVQTQDPLWVDRIKEAVNSALAAKGWTQVPS